jgi:hypothetical protein
MTGIMAAIAGGTQNIIYAAGLYGPSGVDPVPITSSGNSPITLSRTWVGYYRPAVTASTNFSVTATWTSTYNDGAQYSRGLSCGWQHCHIRIQYRQCQSLHARRHHC